MKPHQIDIFTKLMMSQLVTNSDKLGGANGNMIRSRRQKLNLARRPTIVDRAQEANIWESSDEYSNLGSEHEKRNAKNKPQQQ